MNLDIIDCFCTRSPNSGNRAAVVTDFGGDSDARQTIAHKLNLPVTVFLSNVDAEVPLVEYFYPNAEMPLCLHGTLAAGTVFFKKRKVESCSFITSKQYKLNLKKAGALIQVAVTKQPAPRINLNHAAVCKMLNLVDEALINDGDYPMAVCSVGSPKLLVPMVNEQSLLELQPDFEFIKSWSVANQVNGLYVYAISGAPSSDSEVVATARGFNPKAGHHEDAATGVAAAALALYFKKSLVVQQGISLKTPCVLAATYIDDEQILVGGEVATISPDKYYSILEG